MGDTKCDFYVNFKALRLYSLTYLQNHKRVMQNHLKLLEDIKELRAFSIQSRIYTTYALICLLRQSREKTYTDMQFTHSHQRGFWWLYCLQYFFLIYGSSLN